jgi:hypothetical protein
VEDAVIINKSDPFQGPPCRLCLVATRLDVYVAPCGGMTGLAVYTCPACGAIDSDVVEQAPDSPETEITERRTLS